MCPALLLITSFLCIWLMVEVTQCKQILLTSSFSISAHGFECVRIQQCGLGYFVFLL